MKKKKTITIVLSSFAVLLVMIAAAVWGMFGGILTAANTIHLLEDDLYMMEFDGDYGFDDFLRNGGASSDSALADYLITFLSHGFYKQESKLETGSFGCSFVAAEQKDGNYIYGRNYDWERCKAIIVHTVPRNGYESVSTGCVDFLGFGENYMPDSSLMERMQAIASIYIPLDGMNEKGLVVADLIAGDKEPTHQQRGKTPLTTTTAIRLLLDRAATVDEAIELLRAYDMNSSIGSAHHLAIADASGKSVVVEYIDNEMVVTETKVVTNHILADGPKYGIGSEQSHLRYEKLSEILETAPQTSVKDMLWSVAQFNYPQDEGSYEKTMWSLVYGPSQGTAKFYFNENDDHFYSLRLSQKGQWIDKQ